MNTKEYDPREILKRIPTVFEGYEFKQFFYAEKAFELTSLNELKFITSEKKAEFFYIGSTDVPRFLDNIILKALALGYIYDNQDEPLKDLLTKKAKDQLEFGKLKNIVSHELPITSKTTL